MRTVRAAVSHTDSYVVHILLLLVLLVWMVQWPHLRTDAEATQAAPLSPSSYRSSPSLIQNLVDAISQETIAQHIRYLQDDPNTPGLDSLGTRYSRSPGLAHAAEYIAREFGQFGLDVEYDEFPYLGAVITNVVATLPGVGAESDGTYIAGAHFDSTARRTFDWDWQSDPAPGADDNASGTAVVLELARVLSQEQFAHTLRFITFGGEEQGLLGSGHYAREAALADQDIRGMINLDMVSWDGDGDRVMEIHAGTQPASIALAKVWKTALLAYDLNLVPQTWITGATTLSDHASFWARGYPAMLLIEDYLGPDNDFSPFYHTTSDTFDKLDMSFAVDFARATVATLATLAGPIAPDVAVTKSGPAMAWPGGVLTYTLVYSNAGAETATSILLTDTLPEGLTYLSDDSGLAVVELEPGVIGWQVGTLVPGEGGDFNLVLALDVGVQPGTLLTNTVSISATEPEAELNNNAAVAVTTVIAGPPGQVTVVAYPLAIPADGRATAMITVTVTDVAGFAVEDGTPVSFTTDLGTVQPLETQTQNGVVTATLHSEQRVGTAVVTALAGQVWGEAAVAFQPADVSISKTVEPMVVVPGGLITYTLVFSNLGPATATEVSMMDPFLPELCDLAYSFDGPTIIPGDFPQQWRVADLAPGQGGIITITARIDRSAFWSDKLTLDNEATISSATVDVNLENNTSAAVAALVRRIYLPLVSVR